MEADIAAGRQETVDPRYAFGYVRLRILARDRRPTAVARALGAWLREAAATSTAADAAGRTDDDVEKR